MRRLPLIAAVLALPAATAHGAPTRHHEQPPRQPQQQQQQQQQQRPTAYEATLHLTRTIGSRPAGSPGELRAHRYVAARFRAAGLRVGFERFAVPGRGRSRDVVGALDTPARCLTILMAHADTVPPGPGANDNAPGVGVLTALAARLRSGPRPGCDVWLVATGAEERPFTGQPDHLGARALVRRVGRLERRADLRLALSLDGSAAARASSCSLRTRAPGSRSKARSSPPPAAPTRQSASRPTRAPATPTTASSSSAASRRPSSARGTARSPADTAPATPGSASTAPR
jgi:hypothetical protein